MNIPYYDRQAATVAYGVAFQILNNGHPEQFGPIKTGRPFLPTLLKENRGRFHFEHGIVVTVVLTEDENCYMRDENERIGEQDNPWKRIPEGWDLSYLKLRFWRHLSRRPSGEEKIQIVFEKESELRDLYERCDWGITPRVFSQRRHDEAWENYLRYTG